MFIENSQYKLEEQENKWLSKHYIERAHISGLDNIALDLADRLYIRHRLGGVEYIISDQPHELLGLTQKRWRRMTRLVIKKRDAANDAEQIIELSHQISYMQNLRLTEEPASDTEARVVIATYESVANCPPPCRTMFITKRLDYAAIRLITAKMPIPGHIVIYE